MLKALASHKSYEEDFLEEAIILCLISLIVFFPTVPFQFFGLPGVFLSITTGAAISSIVELFLEVVRSKREDIND